MVCLNSVIAAELNFHVLGIGFGNEVVVPAYTYTFSTSVALHTGATVVMANFVRRILWKRTTIRQIPPMPSMHPGRESLSEHWRIFPPSLSMR